MVNTSHKNSTVFILFSCIVRLVSDIYDVVCNSYIVYKKHNRHGVVNSFISAIVDMSCILAETHIDRIDYQCLVIPKKKETNNTQNKSLLFIFKISYMNMTYEYAVLWMNFILVIFRRNSSFLGIICICDLWQKADFLEAISERKAWFYKNLRSIFVHQILKWWNIWLYFS